MPQMKSMGLTFLTPHTQNVGLPQNRDHLQQAETTTLVFAHSPVSAAGIRDWTWMKSTRPDFPSGPEFLNPPSGLGMVTIEELMQMRGAQNTPQSFCSCPDRHHEQIKGKLSLAQWPGPLGKPSTSKPTDS